MPKFNFYSVWIDPVFYAWAALFAAALFTLVYSIRRYLELKNVGVFEEEADLLGGAAAVREAEEPAAKLMEQPELPAAAPVPAPVPAASRPQPAAAQDAPGGNRAETFVRGIYEGISGLDSRLKGIEASLSKSRVNNDFTVKFLEDILQDMESLDKEKLKARIEYLVSDLKK